MDVDSAEARDGKAADERDPAYFSYYSQFVHQQNMLQDTTRTHLYQTAISGAQLKGKVVLDVGAGSGILSYFAAQAGAEKVYAVEASSMARHIKKLVACRTANAWLAGRIEVIESKIERPLPIPKVDAIVSEPIGVLLVHERMLESYVNARDRFLKPGGVMIPSKATIHLAPFSDSTLWTQTMSKVRFWEQTNFHGVDFSPLADDAKDEVFGQPVVGLFDSRILLGPASPFPVDFATVKVEELLEIVIPIEWDAAYTGIIHGIAGWFDVDLHGSTVLSTAPSSDRTHWQQVRFLFKEPLAVNAYDRVSGFMRLRVNDNRSYDVDAEVVIGELDYLTGAMGADDGEHDRVAARTFRRGEWLLHQQTYYYGSESVVPDGGAFYPEAAGLYEPDVSPGKSE